MHDNLSIVWYSYDTIMPPLKLSLDEGGDHPRRLPVLPNGAKAWFTDHGIGDVKVESNADDTGGTVQWLDRHNAARVTMNVFEHGTRNIPIKNKFGRQVILIVSHVPLEKKMLTSADTARLQTIVAQTPPELDSSD